MWPIRTSFALVQEDVDMRLPHWTTYFIGQIFRQCPAHIKHIKTYHAISIISMEPANQLGCWGGVALRKNSKKLGIFVQWTWTLAALCTTWCWNILKWVGGLEHFLFHILGIIIPTDFHICSEELNHQPEIYWMMIRWKPARCLRFCTSTRS